MGPKSLTLYLESITYSTKKPTIQGRHIQPVTTWGQAEDIEKMRRLEQGKYSKKGIAKAYKDKNYMSVKKPKELTWNK